MGIVEAQRAASARGGVDIHPSALVDKRAELGEGVSIGPFCTVGPDVTIGAGARLVSHVVLDGLTTIGAGCTIYPFATVGMPPQDLKYRGGATRTVIGDRTVLREHVTVHRGTETGTGITAVGADCLLMAVVHVAHDCAIADNVIIANNVVMGGHVEIATGARVMGAAALHQFVRIGTGAVVGGVAGVERDVIPYGSVLGNRARLVGLNWVGLRRSGASAEELQRLRHAFRALFPRGGSAEAFGERLARVRAEWGGEARVATILDFIDGAGKRGLVPAAIHGSLGADEDDAAS